QLNQFQVHFADGGEVIFHDLHAYVHDLLHALQDVQPAAAPVALERIGGIRHQLEFAQDKLRDHDNPVQKAGLRDIGDAAVDNYAGVEDFEALAALFFRSKNAAQRGQVQQVTLVGAHDQPHIGHQ